MGRFDLWLMKYCLLLILTCLGLPRAISQEYQESTLMDNINALKDFNQIPEERKTLLKELGDEVHLAMTNSDTVKITFICTHNSRRSQLSELWMRVAAHHYNLQGINTYSGGTESTAFNHRMVAALNRFGFEITQLDLSSNPKYSIGMPGDVQWNQVMYSKKYSDPYNPIINFIAVMVCGHADRNCPFVPGASARIALPYLDPKEYDDTAEEAKAYDDKVMEIGREILFLAKYIKELG